MARSSFLAFMLWMSACLLLVLRASCFYLPGVAPQDFQKVGTSVPPDILCSCSSVSLCTRTFDSLLEEQLCLNIESVRLHALSSLDSTYCMHGSLRLYVIVPFRRIWKGILSCICLAYSAWNFIVIAHWMDFLKKICKIFAQLVHFRYMWRFFCLYVNMHIFQRILMLSMQLLWNDASNSSVI